MNRIADSMSDSPQHYKLFRQILLDRRFVPAGRIQRAMGSSSETTPYNCYVAPAIQDSLVSGNNSIMAVAKEAAATLRLGGGIGYDFSTLRPRGATIGALNTTSTGAVSFMQIFNAVCLTIQAAGHRRGAQMGVLRVDHPDIEEFIRAKQNTHNLTGFNISVGITDDFMVAVQNDTDFVLRFEGRPYKTIRARILWDKIMRSTWDWAEPGVLFLDTINKRNNLKQQEKIAATNPCGEQPLPPYGACLLGSFNLPAYLVLRPAPNGNGGNVFEFNFEKFAADIPVVVRAMDLVIDRARYPLYEQKLEATRKRRMGLGVMGAANAIEAIGYSYGNDKFCSMLARILNHLQIHAYDASQQLAEEKGPFPLFTMGGYGWDLDRRLGKELASRIRLRGLRNSHLTSIAPTGTISLCTDNVSSGIEPVFDYKVLRTIWRTEGIVQEMVEDYGYKHLGVEGKTMRECSVQDHLNVLATASNYVDSAVSKTVNVPSNYGWEDFKDVYMQAWLLGAKGCTTYKEGGKREGILKAASETTQLTADEDYPVPAQTLQMCEIIDGRRSCE